DPHQRPFTCLRGVALDRLMVTSTALPGASSSARIPECAATRSVRLGAAQEPLAATARPASCTPPVAPCEGAVRRRMWAAPRPPPTSRRSASGLVPGGSSSTSTTFKEWSGSENAAATRLGELSPDGISPGEPSAGEPTAGGPSGGLVTGEPPTVIVVGSGRSPTSDLVSSSAYQSGWARSPPAAR